MVHRRCHASHLRRGPHKFQHSPQAPPLFFFFWTASGTTQPATVCPCAGDRMLRHSEVAHVFFEPAVATGAASQVFSSLAQVKTGCPQSHDLTARPTFTSVQGNLGHLERGFLPSPCVSAIQCQPPPTLLKECETRKRTFHHTYRSCCAELNRFLPSVFDAHAGVWDEDPKHIAHLPVRCNLPQLGPAHLFITSARAISAHVLHAQQYLSAPRLPRASWRSSMSRARWARFVVVLFPCTLVAAGQLVCFSGSAPAFRAHFRALRCFVSRPFPSPPLPCLVEFRGALLPHPSFGSS